ncbi:MAG: putative metallopeptidase [Candidatus Diapherotrites archaeon]
MKYEFSEEWTKKARGVAMILGFEHVELHRIACVVSKGTKTRRTIARIHTISKAIQTGMQDKAFYSIELISEKFDRLSEEEKMKTLIHELMHIPHSFGGGFRHHKNYVTATKVNDEYQKYLKQVRPF